MSGPIKNEPQSLEIPNHPKPPIQCLSYGTLPPQLIFTHGAGGTLTSEAIQNFASGFSGLGHDNDSASILCFQGNMQLKSRTTMFTSVISHCRQQLEDESFTFALGGRSMGARAAVMAAANTAQESKSLHPARSLVLVSYPLQTAKAVRDQILLDIHPNSKVLFMVGTKDSMCDLNLLNGVRLQMRCRTWLIAVTNAHHGMDVSPKTHTREIGLLTGRLAREWLLNHENEEDTEGMIDWDDEKDQPSWSGWSPHSSAADTKRTTQTPSEAESTDAAEAQEKRLAKKRPRQTTDELLREAETIPLRRSARTRKGR